MTAHFEDEEPTPLCKGFTPTSRVVSNLSEATGLLVIDVSNLAYRSAYAYNELRTSTGAFSGHVYGSIRLILSTLKNNLSPGAWLLVFCYDGSNAKACRQAVLPSYKANRSADRFNPLHDVRAALQHIPGIHISHPDREGDDAIAWAVEKMHRQDRQLVILSGDRDLWALLEFPGVKVLSPNLKRFVTLQDVKEHYLVDDPARIPFSKALFGDVSDGIKGVERLLKKHVSPHLNAMELNNTNHFLELVENAPKDVTSLNTKSKVRGAHLQILKNLQVISPYTTGFTTENVQKMPALAPARDALRKTLDDYECVSLAERVEELFGAEFYVDGESDDNS